MKTTATLLCCWLFLFPASPTQTAQVSASTEGGSTTGAASDTRPSVIAFISSAIERGVPLFNGGDREGCARVYVDVARELLRLAPDDEERLAPTQMLSDVAPEHEAQHDADVAADVVDAERRRAALRWATHRSAPERTRTRSSLRTVRRCSPGRRPSLRHRHRTTIPPNPTAARAEASRAHTRTRSQ